MSGANKAEVLRGAFDQGGRPDARSGQGGFAWKRAGGATRRQERPGDIRLERAGRTSGDEGGAGS